MCDQFLGTWKLVKSENFEKYMEALDVGVFLRKAACTLKPDVKITLDGSVYTVKTESTFKTSEFQFELGKEFDEVTADGRETKTTVTCDGGVLRQVQKWGDKETTITRVVKDCQMITTCVMGDVKCVRVYEKS